MTASSGYTRPVWEDRFNRPALGELRGGLDATATKLFNTVHRHLTSLDGVGTSFAWHGESWRWTIEYRTRGAEDPLAVMVPSPENLQLAIPLKRDLARTISTRRMKRAVRDGLELAQDPFDTHWGVWSLQPGLIEDIVDLVELKRRHLGQQAG